MKIDALAISKLECSAATKSLKGWYSGYEVEELPGGRPGPHGTYDGWYLEICSKGMLAAVFRSAKIELLVPDGKSAD